MIGSPRAPGRGHAAALLLCTLGACKAGPHAGASGGPPPAPDGGAIEGGVAASIDAGHPEDTLLP